jgi:two-component system response regulator LytT
MNELRILVVEDEIIIADNLINVLQKLGYSTLEPASTYTEAIELIENELPDIALVDISLGGHKTGIDLAKEINKSYKFPFVFLTSNADKVTIDQAKQTNPQAYLVKPFNEKDIYSAIELALHKFSQQNTVLKDDENLIIKGALFIKDQKHYKRVLFKDIVYVVSDHVYLDVHTVNKKKYVVRGSLSDYQQILGEKFFRSHRSYLINLDYLDEIDHKEVIVAGSTLPFGTHHRQELMTLLRRA